MKPYPRTLLRSVALSISLAAITAITALLVSYLLWPVTGIEVEGARMFPESEAWKAVPDHASLPVVNPKALEKKIKSNPWVEGAYVSRNWESGIVMIEVKERRAVIDAEIGGRRVIMAADGTELPGLGGAELERVILDVEQLANVIGVTGALKEGGVAIESVDEVDAGGIRADIEGRTVLFSNTVQAGQVRALKAAMARDADARYFDLRAPGRIVAGGTDTRSAEAEPAASEE